MISGAIRIKQLNKKDYLRLAEFFMGLKAQVFDSWNRFGFSIHDFNPLSVAREMCNLPANKEKGFVCVNRDKKIIAYSYLRFFPDKPAKKHTVSLGIVVNQDYQNKGIGKQLMVFMHKWARKKGIKKIWLATYFRNKKALNLYRKMGYQAEGIFMYDEFGKFGWDHVVSLALMLDGKFRYAKRERRNLMKIIDTGRYW